MHVQGREEDKVDEGEMGGDGMGGWSVGGKEGSRTMGGKRESKGRIEVRLPALLRNGKGNSAKERTLTCI